MTISDSEKLDRIYRWVSKQNSAYPLPPLVSTTAGSLGVHPHDCPTLMTFNEAEKTVAFLGEGWRIPTLEELRILYNNKDNIGGFKTAANPSGSDCPDWYWSSTEIRDYPSYVHTVRFSDGLESWNHKDYTRLSCRPVRLVAAPSLG